VPTESHCLDTPSSRKARSTKRSPLLSQAATKASRSAGSDRHLGWLLSLNTRGRRGTRLSPKPAASLKPIVDRMVLSLSELVGETARGPVRVTLFGSYACTTTRSMWPLVAAIGDSLGKTIDLRFGHVLGASGTPAAHRAAEAAEAGAPRAPRRRGRIGVG
jgi:hypothetical protein